MTKSVYSLLLSDAVVRALDRQAYDMGLSRSALANRILAEHLSYVTPEERLRDVFTAMESFLSEACGFQLMLKPSDSALSLRTALEYKYNPSVKYSVELYKSDTPSGRIKAVLRSQNSDLLLCFSHFFRVWDAVEREFCGDVQSRTSDGKYVREIRGLSGRELSSSELGEYISNYLKLLDGSLKLFFSMLSSQNEAASRIRSAYESFVRREKEVLL